MTERIDSLTQLHEAIRAIRGSLSDGTCPHILWDTIYAEILRSSSLFANSTVEGHDALRASITAMLAHVLPDRQVMFVLHKLRDSDFWHGPIGISEAEVGCFIFDEAIGEGILFLNTRDGQKLLRFSRIMLSPRPAFPN